MPGLSLTATASAVPAVLNAMAMMQMLPITFPSLSFGPEGAPTGPSISRVMEEANELKVPSYPSEYSTRMHINDKTDFYLENAWSNASACKENAEKAKEWYGKLYNPFSPTGIDLNALANLKAAEQKAREHYSLSMQNTKKLYEEINRDLLKLNRELDRLGADANYTGPTAQLYRKTRRIIHGMNKTSCGKKKDIVTRVKCTTKKIKEQRKMNADVYNAVTWKKNSLASKYSSFREQASYKIQDMKKKAGEIHDKAENVDSDLEESIRFLETEETMKIDVNPGTSEKGKVKSGAGGTPREKLIWIKNARRKAKSLLKEGEEVRELKRDNYLADTISKYQKALVTLKNNRKQSKSLKKRLKEIQSHYLEKINQRKDGLTKAMATKYWSEVEKRRERAMEKPTYGERIESLQETLEYIESVEKAEQESVLSIKRKIKNIKTKISKYRELGYPLKDKLQQLDNLKEIENPDNLIQAHEMLEEIKRSIETRLTPLKLKIKRKRNKASKYLQSGEKLSRTPVTKGKISIGKLKRLKEKYRDSMKGKPLEKPVKKLNAYEEIINSVYPAINRLKTDLASAKTTIHIKTDKKPHCNHLIKEEAVVKTENPLSVPLYDLDIEKMLKTDGEEEFLFHINALNPGETKEKHLELKLKPYKCSEIYDKTIKANEDTITKIRKIKVKRKTEHKTLELNPEMPKDTEILYLSHGEVKNGDITVKTPWKEQELKITYKKPSPVKVNENKEEKTANTVQHTITLMNTGEEIHNLTLTRSINAIGRINSNYPLQTKGKNVKITIPRLKTRKTVQLTYTVKDWEKEAEEKITKIKTLRTMKKVPATLANRIKRLITIYENSQYKETVKKSPDIINQLQRQPEEKITPPNSSEKMNGSANVNKSIEIDKKLSLTSIRNRAAKACEFTSCREIEHRLKNVENKDLTQRQVQELKRKLEEIEKRARSNITEGYNEIDNKFQVLKKAFSRTKEYQVSSRYIPYTKKDYSSLVERKKEMKENSLTNTIALSSFESLTQSYTVEELKNQMEKKKKLREDVEDTLSDMKTSSAKRLDRAKKQYEENPSKNAKNYLKEAKTLHQEGRYLDSMHASRKAYESSKAGEGQSIPWRYIAAGLMVSGTVLYYLKKPKGEEDDVEEPRKLKRGN